MIQRQVGGFIPPTASRDPGQDNPHDARDRDIDLWNYLQARPTIPINIPTLTTDLQLLGKQCILAGWSLRETTGTSDAQVEFIDGSSNADPVVGEQGINAPLPGSVGDTFVDVDSTASGAAQTNTATLAALAGATTYITGFEVSGLGATSAGSSTATLGGVDATSPVYSILIPAGVTVPITPLIVQFARPIPATALNTAITVTVTTFGAGNTSAMVHAHGYQLTLGSTANQSGQTATSDLGEPGVLCRSGLWLHVITGSVKGSAWVRV